MSAPAPLSLTAVEDALRGWLLAATGLPEGRVILADQAGTMPGRPYLTLRLGPVLSSGHDAKTQTYDPARPLGEEVEITSSGIRDLTVSVQAFTRDTGGDGGAVALLSRARNALELSSVREALEVASLGVGTAGAVTNLSALSGPEWEGRAALDVRFFVGDSISERTGYIAEFKAAGMLRSD